MELLLIPLMLAVGVFALFCLFAVLSSSLTIGLQLYAFFSKRNRKD